mmetsp:Transcript_28550/g.87632  ORF Transcript_28550/g.87632 Transcript_28550/m.87632 type:complete len:166 (-) Transcript_28550:22-519(-)
MRAKAVLGMAVEAASRMPRSRLCRSPDRNHLQCKAKLVPKRDQAVGVALVQRNSAGRLVSMGCLGWMRRAQVRRTMAVRWMRIASRHCWRELSERDKGASLPQSAKPRCEVGKASVVSGASVADTVSVRLTDQQHLVRMCMSISCACNDMVSPAFQLGNHLLWSV